jgi:Na+-driven multidrug efflux pump
MSMLFVFLLQSPQLHAMGAAVGGVLGFLTGTAVLVMASIARKKEQTAKTVHETVKDEPIE